LGVVAPAFCPTRNQGLLLREPRLEARGAEAVAVTRADLRVAVLGWSHPADPEAREEAKGDKNSAKLPVAHAGD
jgi:hypothetical protein